MRQTPKKNCNAQNYSHTAYSNTVIENISQIRREKNEHKWKSTHSKRVSPLKRNHCKNNSHTHTRKKTEKKLNYEQCKLKKKKPHKTKALKIICIEKWIEGAQRNNQTHVFVTFIFTRCVILFFCFYFKYLRSLFLCVVGSALLSFKQCSWFSFFNILLLFLFYFFFSAARGVNLSLFFLLLS